MDVHSNKQHQETLEPSSEVNIELDPDAEYNEKLRRAQAQWDHRRKAGFEDYGAEMDKDARVWKAYVQETDHADKEMVSGWNKSLDVLLIFATLFSAISTAFLTTVSSDLEPDFEEEMSKTLQAILITLQTVSPEPNNTLSVSTPDPFLPSHTSVVVNTLWYLSLSLSVAVALLAMLAKEWCHLFMSNRTGQMYEQGRRRQQRWDEIERWKMIDVITLLPILMHIALLLFAVGLSIRLWNLNILVAIPVVLTTVIATILYTATYWLPLIFEFCPYATASSKLLRGYMQLGITALCDQAGPLLARIHRHIMPQRSGPTSSYPHPIPWSWVSKKKVEQNPLACAGTALAKGPTPMDLVTSRMLSWMATNCEEPKLVDLVIQSLAGAKPWLPRLPLLQCGLHMQLLDRLYGLIDFDFTKRTYFLKGSATSDLALLYFRALFFLHSFHNREGFYSNPVIESGSLTLENTWGNEFDIRQGGLVVDTLFSSWGYGAKFDLPSDTADAVAYMSVFKLPSCRVGDGSMCAKFDVYECFQAAHDLIEQYIAKKVVYHPATLLMLVQSMTNQFALPSRPWSEFKTLGVHFPIILVKLLEFLQSTSGDEDLYHAIGVGLAICAFTFGKYPVADHAHGKNPGDRVLEVLAYHNTPKHLVHFQSHIRLSLRDSRIMETRSMLNFGLLALLEQPVSPLLNAKTIQCLTKAFQTVDQREHFSYQYVHTLAHDFTFEQHVNVALGQFLQRNSNTLAPYTASNEAAWFSFVSALLNRLTCIPSSLKNAQELDSIYCLVIQTLCNSPSVSLQVNLSKLMNSLNMEVFTKEFSVTPDQSLLLQLLQSSLSENFRIAPTAMRLTWSLVLHVLRLGGNFIKILAILCQASPCCKSHSTKDIGDTCLAHLWLPRLRAMCIDSPCPVVDSNILQVMLNFYLQDSTGVYNHGKPYQEIIDVLRGLQDICVQNLYKPS